MGKIAIVKPVLLGHQISKEGSWGHGSPGILFSLSEALDRVFSAYSHLTILVPWEHRKKKSLGQKQRQIQTFQECCLNILQLVIFVKPSNTL